MQSRLEIVIDSTSGERRLKSLNYQLGATEKSGDRLTRATGGVNDELRRMRTVTLAATGALGGLAGVMSAREVIRYADTWQNVTNQLRQVTDSTTELESIQAQLLETANETRSGFDSTANLYARLARSTTELDLSQRDLLGITRTINQSFATSGATATEASAAITQLSQGLASGALRGDEFNSVAEQAPDIMRAIAASLGLTIGELRDFAAEGGITAEIVVNALREASDEIGGRFADSVATFGQKAEVANNNLMAWIGTSNEVNGVVGKLGDGLVTLSENLDGIVTLAGGAATLFAGRLAGATATAAGGMLAAQIEAARYQATLASMAGVTRAAAASQLALGTATRGAAGALALVGGPVGAAVVAGGALYYFREELGFVQPELRASSERVAELVGSLDALSQAAIRTRISELTSDLAKLKTEFIGVTEIGTAADSGRRRGSGTLGLAAGELGRQTRAIQDAVSGVGEGILSPQTQAEIKAHEQALSDLQNQLDSLEGTNIRTAGSFAALSGDTKDAAKAAREAERELERLASGFQSLYDRLRPVEASQRRYREDQEIVNRAVEAGLLPLAEQSRLLQELERDYRNAGDAASVYGFTGSGRRDEDQDSYWDRWLAGAETAFTDFDQLAANTAQSFQQGFGNAFESMIFDSKSAGSAARTMFEGVSRTAVNALGQMAGQWVAYQGVQMATGRTMEAAAIAGAATTGTAIASAYAPAATMASLASFGANSAPAMAGISSTFALSKGLALTGMAHDGLDRVPREGTWLLDKGERVVSRPQADRLDRYLDQQEEKAAPSQAPTVIINEAPPGTKADARQDDDGRWVVEVMVADLNGDGRFAKAMGQTYGMRRQGR
ncbi:tape measure protein [Billgrantia sp. LNSP4103-1]|uniref:tape measure protein n=1 Tax=Billgrantia sp. LNSP4103-1 TaxID=3410266 RepID=UPI00403F99AC